MKKMAVCIPIYGTPELAEEFLSEYANYYCKFDYDIYYYDSSVDDSVKEVVERYKNESIYYVRMPPTLRVIEKGFKIYQGYGLKEEYEYIWLCTAGVRFSLEALCGVENNLNLKYDVICFNIPNNSFNRTNSKEFILNSPEDFFCLCGCTTTLFGGIIVHSQSMLKDVNWGEYSYHLPSGEINEWAHINFYFQRALKISTFKGLILPKYKNVPRASNLKKGSFWRDACFKMLCEDLVYTIKELPSNYEASKKKVCVDIGESVFRDIKAMLQFREEGIYSINTFIKYVNVWEWITTVPRTSLFFISLIPKFLLKLRTNLMNKIIHKQLKRFCNKYDKIAIYGTGFAGYVLSKYMDKHGIKYDYFCSTSGDKKYFCQRPVYKFSDTLSNKENMGYVLAMSQENMSSVFETISKYIGNGRVFYKYRFFEPVAKELGFYRF